MSHRVNIFISVLTLFAAVTYLLLELKSYNDLQTRGIEVEAIVIDVVEPIGRMSISNTGSFRLARTVSLGYEDKEWEIHWPTKIENGAKVNSVLDPYDSENAVIGSRLDSFYEYQLRTNDWFTWLCETILYILGAISIYNLFIAGVSITRAAKYGR